MCRVILDVNKAIGISNLLSQMNNVVSVSTQRMSTTHWR